MSRTLPARTDALKDRAAAAPIYLLKGELTAPGALTLYVGDGALAAVSHVAGGQEWLPIVLSWGDIESALEQMSAGGAPATFEVTFSNNMPVQGKSRFSDLIRSTLNTTGTYVFTNSKWTLYEVLETAAAAADLVTLGVFYVEDAPALGSRTVRLRMIDPSGYIEKRQVVTKLDETTFPTADPDDMGKAISRVFGSGNQSVRARAASGGGVTFLLSSIAGGSTGGVGDNVLVNVHDASRCASSGSVLVEASTWKYAKTGVTNQLRLSNAVGTTGKGYLPGTPVIEIKTAFTYILCENIGTTGAGVGKHKHKTVSNVRTKNLPLTATQNLDDGTLDATKSFVTLAFTVTPGQLQSRSTGSNAPPTSPVSVTTPYRGTNIRGAKIALSLPVSPAAAAKRTGTFTINVDATAPPGVVTDVRRRARFRISSAPTTSTSFLIRRDSATGAILAQGTKLTIGETQPFSWGTGPPVVGVPTSGKGNQVIYFEVTGQGATSKANFATLEIIEFQEDVESIVQAPSPDITVSDLVIGEVLADVEGLQDDSAGTITGTPSLLLEIPADIAKVIMRYLFGIASADFGSTWAATRTSQSAASLKWAFILGAERFSDLRARLGDQGQAALFWDSGQCHYKYLTTSPSAGLTLIYGTDVIDLDDAGVSQTAGTKVVNHLNVYSNRDNRKTGSLADVYRSMKVFEDLTQVGFTDAIPEDVELDLVTDTTTRDAIGAFLLARRKRQRFEYSPVALWNVLAVESLDYVAVSGHPVLTAHGDTSLIFEVRRKRAMPSAENPGRVMLGLFEANA